MTRPDLRRTEGNRGDELSQACCNVYSGLTKTDILETYRGQLRLAERQAASFVYPLGHLQRRRPASDCNTAGGLPGSVNVISKMLPMMFRVLRDGGRRHANTRCRLRPRHEKRGLRMRRRQQLHLTVGSRPADRHSRCNGPMMRCRSTNTCGRCPPPRRVYVRHDQQRSLTDPFQALRQGDRHPAGAE